jgi:SPOR domain
VQKNSFTLTNLAIFLQCKEKYVTMYKVIFGLFLILGAVTAKAQTPAEVTDSIPTDSIRIDQDDRIEQLLDKKITIQTVVKTKTDLPVSTRHVREDKWGRVTMPGFRVQVLNTTDRALVYTQKAVLYQRFPSQKLYVIAQSPFFKLRMGNFSSKAEADKYKKMLSPMYPNGVYVVPDTIESRVIRTEIRTVPITEKKEDPKKGKKTTKNVTK